jgi:hypothetical protein
MSVRYLSDPELARLSGWPEIADDDAVTYFTLSGWTGFNRVAVQLSAMPWLGGIPDDLGA